MSAHPRRIAVFQALNLGDLLCTTPALRAIRHGFPAAEITFIGRPWAQELIARLGTADCFLTFPGFPGIVESPAFTPSPSPIAMGEGLSPLALCAGRARQGGESERTGSRTRDNGSPRRSLAAHSPRFDLAIQMHGSGEVSNGFIATLGARQSIGYGPPGDTRLSQVLEWIEAEPEPLRWLRLVEAAGARSLGAALEFPVTQSERLRAAAMIGPPNERPVIGLHVGSSLPNRRWPAASFARLGDALVDRCGARIVLTGSEPEQTLTARVRQSMRRDAVDLAGQTGLGEFAAVIAALDLLVTNDTGASHVAAATRTPSVVLYGPSRPERWGPLDQDLHCRIDAMAGSDGAAALQRLPVARVLAECVAMMNDIDPIANETTEERIA
jgi:ADP-heptose:LPS heptosyltransferase